MTQKTETTAAKTLSNAPAASTLPKGMTPLVTRRRKFHQDVGSVLYGKLIAYGSMPGREPWNAFIVELLAPTTAVDREGELSEAMPPEQVILGESAGLRALIPFASKPDTMIDVHIRVLGRDKKAKGQPWQFEINKTEAYERQSKYAPANFGLGVAVNKLATDVAGDGDAAPF